MIEERSLHLFSALEARADDALDELCRCRMRIQELEVRLAEFEALRQELEAARLELMEENRELDEQNRELEEDNTRLRERLRKGEPAPVFPGATRRAQGLAALMGQRPREEPAQESERREANGQREATGDAGRDQAAATAETPRDAAAAPRSRFAVSRDTATPAEPEPRGEEGQGEERPAVQGERQGALAIEQAPSADALLKQWYQRYPQTFFKGHTRPLKVGIHHDLTAREPWPEKLVRRALAGYVNLPRYLKAVREGAERIDLDGAPAGSVDADAAEHAKRKLERLQSKRRELGRAAGGNPRREGGKARSTRNGGGDGQPRKAERSARLAGGSQEAAPAEPPGVPADPKARMEAKLSALLAKHNGQAKGH